jgi:uncharacterized protein
MLSINKRELMNIQDNEKMEYDKILSNPLKTFDQILYIEKQENSPKWQKHQKKMILRCLLALGGNTKSAINCADNEVEILAKEALDKHVSLNNREIVAMCYLRLLLDDDMSWASKPPWRPKIIDFIDALFENSIYKEFKIDPGLQTHEKIPLLREIILKQEALLKASLDALTSLERISSHRQKLMTAINNRIGKRLIKPLLPNNIESLLNDIYEKIEVYIEQRESTNVIDAFSDTVNNINEFINILETKNTSYDKIIALKFKDTLLALLEDDFTNNKAAQPAALSVEANAKKYPLHIIGNQIKLGIIICNSGPGYSYETQIEVISLDEKLCIETPLVDLGRVPPSENLLIEIPSVVNSASECINVLGSIKWKNYNGDNIVEDFQIRLEAQRNDIDWAGLVQTYPYSLEPVENENQLVGRKEVLNRLVGSLNANNTGSSIIHGQKRVGKTSIAKVLHSLQKKENQIAIYLDAGDYVMPSASATVKRLGYVLCKRILDCEQRLSSLTIPDFDEAFSPITDFFDAIHNILPEKKIILILDEFDRLPLELYARGVWGDSFFLTLRSLSSRANVGFVLVGGERMAHIMDCQGVQLNKWSMVPVDYFLRETDWEDFKELVQRPVNKVLDYSEEAILELHNLTSGNPYFTIVICQYVFSFAVQNRDCFITKVEVTRAVNQAIVETAVNTFQHFWEDRIFESGDKAAEKSIRRRKILIALSDVLKKVSPANGKTLANHPLLIDSPALESDLKEFVTRKVLVGQITNVFFDHTYAFKVEFFHKWLNSHGVQSVIATFSDLDAAMRERQLEENLKVQANEIVDLIANWKTYRGLSISTDMVRLWLEQFSDTKEQRAMFKILQGVKFYTNNYLRVKMKEAHTIITRGLGRYQTYRQQKRSDILVSYLDSIGKSGAWFAKLYADEAQVYVDNIVEKNKLISEIDKRSDTKVVVFLDDFVGTGNQATENLEWVNTNLGNLVKERKIKIVFIAVVAVKEGWNFLNEQVSEMDIDVETHYCELLDDSSKYFTEKSTIFTNPNDREFAKDIAKRYGKLLVKNSPLGYGGLGVGVVFENRCPNDSLPILWSESTSPKWRALFKR